MKRLLTLFFALCFWLPSNGQYLHYTQFDMAPLNLNPAHTGAFFGTFRIGGIYRDQFFNVPGFSGSFTSPNISIDAPIIKGFRSQDWVGVGVNMFQDQVGALELTTGAFLGSAAYHIGLDKDASSTISIGIQAGYVSRGFQNAQAASWGEVNEMVMDDNVNFFDMGAGVMYRGLLSDNALLEMGVSMFHLTKPDYTRGSRDGLPRQFVAHTRLKNYLTNEITLTPSVLYMAMNGRTQFAVQGVAGFMFDPEKQIELNAGLGYRFNDLSSAQLLAGIAWGDFKAGFAYDFGLSSASFDGGQQPGGFELAASYVAKIYRKPKPKPTIFCPRF